MNVHSGPEVSPVIASYVRRRSVLISAVLLLAGGCGLTDYEEKMIKEQKKQDFADEQEKHLGEPAEITVKTDPSSTQPAVDVFLRVPKGISPKPTSNWGELFYQYDRLAPPRMRYGVAPPPESPFFKFLVAVAPPGDWKEFTDKAQHPFQGMTHAEFTRASKTQLGRPPMDFQTTTYTDTAQTPTSYVVYLHQATKPGGEPLARVAIAFNTYKDRANSPELIKAMDLCLQSLVIGPDAAVARQQYKPK